jgi:hypothetical protein
VLKGADELGSTNLPRVPRFTITTAPHPSVVRAIAHGHVVVRRLG